MRNSSREVPQVKRGNRGDLIDAGDNAARHLPAPALRAAAASSGAGPGPGSGGLPEAELTLAEQLPESRAGRAAVAILDAVQQTAEEHGYFAAGEEASRRLRAARELRSPERRFLSDTLADVLRGLRRLRTLADRKKMGGRALYLTYLVDKSLTANPQRQRRGYPDADALKEDAELPRVLGHKAAEGPG